MASINLGRVGFVLRGTWSSSASYQPLDVVLYNGASYAARIASSGITPSNSSAWQELTDIENAVESGIDRAAVRFDEAQSLNGSEQTTARENIGAASNAEVTALGNRVNATESTANINSAKISILENGAVRHDIEQTLTETQKIQALENIGADQGMYFAGTITDGHYINYANGAVGGDNENFHYAEAPVAYGMVIYYNSTIGTPDSRGLAFYNRNGVFISGSGVQMTETPQVIPVPENACYVKATYRNSKNEIVISGYNAPIMRSVRDVNELMQAAVRYDEAQDLTSTQKSQARANIQAAKITATDYSGNDSGILIEY